jgi:hypothetical protein
MPPLLLLLLYLHAGVDCQILGSTSWWSSINAPDSCEDSLAATFSCSNCSATGSISFDATGCTFTRELKGHVAVVERGSCTFSQKASVAEQAGAIALLIVNNVPGEAIFMTANPGEKDSFGIPVLMVSQACGQRIETLLAEGAVAAGSVVVQAKGSMASPQPPSRVHKVEKGASTSDHGEQVIAATFGGRRDRMSLTVRYVVRLLDLGMLDEYHVWAYNRTVEDGVWMREVLPALHPHIQVFEPATFNLHENYHFFDFYSHYNSRCDSIAHTRLLTLIHIRMRMPFVLIHACTPSVQRVC